MLNRNLSPFRTAFSSDPEKTLQTTFNVLKKRAGLTAGDKVVVISDVLSGLWHRRHSDPHPALTSEESSASEVGRSPTYIVVSDSINENAQLYGRVFQVLANGFARHKVVKRRPAIDQNHNHQGVAQALIAIVHTQHITQDARQQRSQTHADQVQDKEQDSRG